MPRPAGTIGERHVVIIATDEHDHVIEEFHPEFPIERSTNEVNTAELEVRTQASLPAVRDEVLRAINNSDDPRLAQATHVSVYIVPTDADTAKVLQWADDSEPTMYGVGTDVRLALIRKAVISKTIKIEDNGTIQPLVTPAEGVTLVQTPKVVIPAQRTGSHDADDKSTVMILIAVCGRYNNDPREEFTLGELDQYLPPVPSRESNISEERYLDMFHVLINQALAQAFGDDQTTSIQSVVTVTRVIFGEIPIADFPSIEGQDRNEVFNTERFHMVNHFVPGSTE